MGEELTDGQVVPFAGGIRVVHTPGHSPGHASYLLEESGVLITGDAIFNVLGRRWPLKMLCTNFAMTKKTAQRLGELEYSTAAFTHGPEIRDEPPRSHPEVPRQVRLSAEVPHAGASARRVRRRAASSGHRARAAAG